MNRLHVFPALARLARIVGSLAAALFLSTQSLASVTLAWDPVSNATGYYIHYGPSAGNYPSKIDVGKVTTHTVQGLTEGAAYHFVATAYDATSESAPSNNVMASNPYAVPVASFTASASSGTSPLAINMVNTSTGTILSHAWTFGDGTTSTTPNPSKVYSAPGTYSVGLTVTGPGGTNQMTRSNYITVSAPTGGLFAQFTANVTTGGTPTAVQFTSTSTGSITTYYWSFGDGTTSAQANPSHTYTAPGKYTVVLMVTGAAGSNQMTKTRYIDIKRKAH
jgi:PKD repeat protein